MTMVETIVGLLNKVHGASAGGLVCLSCIALGYILRFIKPFPPDGIPVAMVLWGAIVMSVIADSRPTTMSLRVWVVRNVLVGMVIGMVAWIVQKVLLNRLENWVKSWRKNGGPNGKPT